MARLPQALNQAARRLSAGDVLPLHDRVVAELRRAIVSGRFKPGERLVEERLAEELGVSRIPVREAIRALASQGLVVLTARRGASVAMPSLQEARETIELRALLEGQNARLATRRRDPKVLKRIRAVLDKGAAAVAAGRFEQLAPLNQQFHEAVAAAGQNTVLSGFLMGLRDRTEMLFAPTLSSRQHVLWQEHAAILRAIIGGDEEVAAELSAAHVIGAGEDFLAAQAALAESPEPPRRKRAA